MIFSGLWRYIESRFCCTTDGQSFVWDFYSLMSRYATSDNCKIKLQIQECDLWFASIINYNKLLASLSLYCKLVPYCGCCNWPNLWSHALKLQCNEELTCLTRALCARRNVMWLLWYISQSVTHSGPCSCSWNSSILPYTHPKFNWRILFVVPLEQSTYISPDH